jgi:hypothetical protein
MLLLGPKRLFSVRTSEPWVGFADAVSAGHWASMAAKKLAIDDALVAPFNVSVVGPTPSTVKIMVLPSRVPAGTLQLRGPASGDTAPELLMVTEVAEMYPVTTNVPSFMVSPPVNVMDCPTMAGVIPVRPATVARGVVKLVMDAPVPDNAGP